MISKGNKLYSIIFLKCPQCHEGEFLESHPYNLGNYNRVRETCPSCGLKYKIEPSFYYGSMYVSYAVGVAIGVAVFVLITLFGVELSVGGLFAAIVGALIMLMPWIGAVSKSIWANFFFKYNKNAHNLNRAK
jgi:uncharacterized protein (DUF983 family)